MKLGEAIPLLESQIASKLQEVDELKLDTSRSLSIWNREISSDERKVALLQFMISLLKTLQGYDSEQGMFICDDPLYKGEGHIPLW